MTSSVSSSVVLAVVSSVSNAQSSFSGILTFTDGGITYALTFTDDTTETALTL